MYENFYNGAVNLTIWLAKLDGMGPSSFYSENLCKALQVCIIKAADDMRILKLP